VSVGSLRLALAAVLIGGLALFALLAVVVGAGGAVGLDRGAFSLASDLRAPAALDVARVVTDAGAGFIAWPLALAVAALLAARGSVRASLALAGSTVLVVVLVGVAKDAVGRPRPPAALVGTHGLSYPSGHSAYSTLWVASALALVLGLRDAISRRVRLAVLGGALAIALVIGLTRVYLRAHDLTDVLGGWALGGATLAVCALASGAIAGRRHNRSSR